MNIVIEFILFNGTLLIAHEHFEKLLNESAFLGVLLSIKMWLFKNTHFLSLSSKSCCVSMNRVTIAAIAGCTQASLRASLRLTFYHSIPMNHGFPTVQIFCTTKALVPLNEG